jgi:hypothetical protein
LIQQKLPVLHYKTLHQLLHCFLTTEAVIADKPEKNPAPAMPDGGGGMDF